MNEQNSDWSSRNQGPSVSNFPPPIRDYSHHGPPPEPFGVFNKDLRPNIFSNPPPLQNTFFNTRPIQQTNFTNYCVRPSSISNQQMGVPAMTQEFYPSPQNQQRCSNWTRTTFPSQGPNTIHPFQRPLLPQQGPLALPNQESPSFPLERSVISPFQCSSKQQLSQNFNQHLNCEKSKQDFLSNPPPILKPLSDEQWLNRWIQKIQNKDSNMEKQKQKMINSFGIASYQRKQKDFEDLKSELKEISTVIQNLSSFEERQILEERAKIITSAIESLKNFFEDCTTKSTLNSLVTERREKRARRKRKKDSLKQRREKILKQREAKHKVIDDWLERTQKEHKNKLEEAESKKNVDQFLSKVRRMRQEAKEIRTLVDSLQKLRQIRLKKGETHGFVSNAENQEKFDGYSEQLCRVIQEQMTRYDSWELDIRSILSNGSNPSDLNDKEEEEQIDEVSLKQQLEEVLFGSCLEENESLDTSEALVARRRDWDQFVVETSSELASSVPLGWVTPSIDPPPQWTRFKLGS